MVSSIPVYKLFVLVRNTHNRVKKYLLRNNYICKYDRYNERDSLTSYHKITLDG